MAGACPSKACVLFKPKRGPAVRRASWPLAGLGGDVRQEAVAGGTGHVAGRAATGPVTTNNDGSVTDGGSCSQASSQRDRDRDIDADPNSS